MKNFAAAGSRRAGRTASAAAEAASSAAREQAGAAQRRTSKVSRGGQRRAVSGAGVLFCSRHTAGANHPRLPARSSPSLGPTCLAPATAQAVCAAPRACRARAVDSHSCQHGPASAPSAVPLGQRGARLLGSAAEQQQQQGARASWCLPCGSTGGWARVQVVCATAAWHATGNCRPASPGINAAGAGLAGTTRGRLLPLGQQGRRRAPRTARFYL